MIALVVAMTESRLSRACRRHIGPLDSPSCPGYQRMDPGRRTTDPSSRPTAAVGGDDLPFGVTVLVSVDAQAYTEAGERSL
jgi:hypothetical protein